MRPTEPNLEIQKELTNTEQNNRKRNVNQHIPTNQKENVTLRKNQKPKKQTQIT